MNKKSKRTHPSGILSLNSLKMILAAAERESPARPFCPLQDPNEQLVLQMIEKIKHPAPISMAVMVEPPRPILAAIREMAGSDAR